MLFFTDWLQNAPGYSAAQQQVDLGWSMIFFVTCMTLFNVYLIVRESCHQFILVLTKYWNLAVYYCERCTR